MQMEKLTLRLPGHLQRAPTGPHPPLPSRAKLCLSPPPQRGESSISSFINFMHLAVVWAVIFRERERKPPQQQSANGCICHRHPAGENGLTLKLTWTWLKISRFWKMSRLVDAKILGGIEMGSGARTGLVLPKNPFHGQFIKHQAFAAISNRTSWHPKEKS